METTMKWITPPENQGQMIEVSYATGNDGTVYRRTVDRSDGSTRYEVADCPATWEPWNAEPDVENWVPCDGLAGEK